jgi:multiple sugar transport system permease protein
MANQQVNQVKPATNGLRAAKSLTAANDFFDDRPVYQEGYDERKNVVIRLVSDKNKNAKPYKVTGIDDVASKNNWKAWLYLAPVLILLVVFLLYPLINTIFIAFLDNYSYIDGSFDGVTLNNFGVIFGLSTYNGATETNFTRYAIPNTFLIVFITVPVSTLIALLISVGLNKIKFLQKALQTIFFLPYVTNAIAIGMVFSVMFDQNGIINTLFNSTTKWIYGADRLHAYVPLCLYIIWSSLPFKILIFLSGLQGIDKQYYNAAKMDGASSNKILWKITVPMMSPQILYILVTSFIGAFKEYTSIVGLFNMQGTSAGSYNMYTIVYYIYDNLSTHTSFAAAAAVFLFVVILVFTFIQLYVSKKRVYY